MDGRPQVNDYLDRALVLLDRAECLILADEPAAAVECAGQALAGLGIEQRDRMIANRAREVLSLAPTALPAARELRAAIQDSAQH